MTPTEAQIITALGSALITGFFTWLKERKKTKKAENALRVTARSVENAENSQTLKEEIKLNMTSEELEKYMKKFVDKHINKKEQQ